jgi:hypothetical protein
MHKLSDNHDQRDAIVMDIAKINSLAEHELEKIE